MLSPEPVAPARDCARTLRTTVAIAAVVLAVCGCGQTAPSPSGSAGDSLGPSATATTQAEGGESAKPTTGEQTPPPNLVVQRIEAALSRIGLEAKVAELSPADRASLWVDVGGGRVLSIETTPASAAPPEWQVIGVRHLASVELKRMRDADGTLTEWMVCGEDLVRASGSPPESDGTLDAFIERLVPELGCR